jgi:hypothetical protein
MLCGTVPLAVEIIVTLVGPPAGLEEVVGGEAGEDGCVGAAHATRVRTSIMMIIRAKIFPIFIFPPCIQIRIIFNLLDLVPSVKRPLSAAN